MPRAALEARENWAQLGMKEMVTQLNRAADELGVTSSALRSRLVELKRLSRRIARSIPDAALVNDGGERLLGQPPLF